MPASQKIWAREMTAPFELPNGNSQEKKDQKHIHTNLHMKQTVHAQWLNWLYVTKPLNL